MQVQIFSIQAIENKEDLQKLNAFLRGHKIIDIAKQFVNNGQDSYWSFCIRYIDSTNNTNANFNNTRKEKIDYKDVLDETTFLKFSKLREIRKEITKYIA